MTKCKFCGREIQDGAACDCDDAVRQHLASLSGTEDGQEDVRDVELQEMYARMERARKTKIAVLVGAAVLVAVIAFAVVFAVLAPRRALKASSYEEAIERFIRGYNNSDAETIMYAVYPSTYILEQQREDGSYWRSSMSEASSEMSEQKKMLEENLFDGHHTRMSAEILNEKSVDKEMLQEVQEHYDGEHCEKKVTKVYELKVKFTLQSEQLIKEETCFVYVAKFRGDGWAIYPESMDSLKLMDADGKAPSRLITAE